MIVRALLVVVAAARGTRFVTEDSLGYWWIVAPARRWANLAEGAMVPTDPVIEADPDPGRGWRSKLVSGLDCRWCVGWWIGVVILVGEALTRTRAFGWARPAWTFVLSALALNSVANLFGKWSGTLS